MQIVEISVKSLFGTFDHTIPLNYPDRVTLIHGSNGIGKTMMLKMIVSLIEGNTRIFKRVPFESFEVHFKDGSFVVIRHDEMHAIEEEISLEEDLISISTKLSITLYNKYVDVIAVINDQISTNIPRSVLDTLDQYVPSPFSRFGPGWRNRSKTGARLISVEEILDMFPRAANALPNKYRTGGLRELFIGTEVFFVETTRLNGESASKRNLSKNEYINEFEFDEIDDENPKFDIRVEQYSSDIVQRIKFILADYAKFSQESDRTFPERLVRFIRDGTPPLTGINILQQMKELEKKRQRLIKLGFLDKESGLTDLSEADVKRAPEALTIYVEDIKHKLSVFDDLSQRVGKLIDIVNDRFKYKTLTLNREEGFRLKTKSGEAIQLEDLSSGEQHQLVVLYELLFRAPRNGLILVDEPEISLHVAWQSRFLPDLMEILELTESYGIVATHSPVIIGSRWDLTQELKGPKEIAEVLQDEI